MAVTEKRSASRIWGVGVRQIVYMALGAALYGGLSWVTNSLQLPSAGNNLLGDYISGYGVFWNWDVGNALIGFIAGLAILYTWGRYNTTQKIVVAEVLSAIGIIVGISLAALNDMWISKLSFTTAVTGEIFPAAGSDLINGLILLPILLVAYNAAVRRTGRA